MAVNKSPGRGSELGQDAGEVRLLPEVSWQETSALLRSPARSCGASSVPRAQGAPSKNSLNPDGACRPITTVSSVPTPS